MKGENKLEGASNYRACKKRIDLILKKNKFSIALEHINKPFLNKENMKINVISI